MSMMTTRRTFLEASLAATALIASGRAWAQDASRGGGAHGKPLKLLILGGTRFLGPALVEAAEAHGHAVTLFNRGRSNPHLFPHLDKLRGDRDPKVGEGLTALVGRTWDAVIDTSGYVPRHVDASAELLADAVAHYVFVSTISVYASLSRPEMDESAALGTLEGESVEEVTATTYGPLKALCEQAAEKAMPGRVTNIRPGLIVGPRDGTDRFTYWPVRIKRGGEVLAPGTPNDPVQFIDVRDLAEWSIRTIEHRTVGIFNATGPPGGLPLGKLLNACRDVTNSDAGLTWVDADFLAKHNVSAWSDLPVWVPPTGDTAGLGRVNVEKAITAGLTYRPTSETIGATLDWFGTLPRERREELRSGLRPEREAAVLRAWHEHLASLGSVGG